VTELPGGAIAPESDLIDPLAAALRAAGYARKLLRWRRVWPDAIGVVDLSPSRVGAHFYLELGVAIAGVEPARAGWFGTEKCHMWARVEDLLPPDQHAWSRRVLDLGSGMAAAERSKAIGALVSNAVAPYHSARSTMEAIRRVVHAPGFPDVLRFGTRAFFGLPPPQPQPPSR